MNEEKQKFCKMIDDAIKDEAGAQEFYGKLISIGTHLLQSTTLEDIKHPEKPHIDWQTLKALNHIRETEDIHKKSFEGLKKYYCSA